MPTESSSDAEERREREVVRDIAQGRARPAPGGDGVEDTPGRDASREEALDRPASEAEETEREKAPERPHWDVAWRSPE